MSDQLVGNVLIVQSGWNSPVSNTVLSGIVSGALNYENIEEIYGSCNGFCGILNDDLIDLAVQPQQIFRHLTFTPGAALGTFDWSERVPEEIDALFEELEKHNIRYLFIIGDQEAQKIALELTQTAQERSYEIRIVSVPETCTNSLPLTDHCLGYGSVAKFIATTVSEISLYAATVGNHDLVNIVEIAGNGSDWLVASALLAKNQKNEACADIVLLPSHSFSEDAFLEQVQTVLKTHASCTVVAGEALVNEEGNFITSASLSAAEKLRNCLLEALEIRVTVTRVGALQLAAAHVLSKTDSDEAFQCGIKAVDFALDGVTGKVVTLLRSDGNRYGVEYSVADLNNVIGREKTIPEHWYTETGHLDNNFVKYVQPLIQGNVAVTEENGLPKFAFLKND